MVRLLALALAFLFPLIALGENLEHFAGWSLEKIAAEAAEDGSYTTRPDYFTLTPPGQRPAITVDSRTAAALRQGQIQAEEVYRKFSKKEETKSEQEFVYSESNAGFVTPDPIAATLTADLKPAMEPKVVEEKPVNKPSVATVAAPGLQSAPSTPFVPPPFLQQTGGASSFVAPPAKPAIPAIAAAAPLVAAVKEKIAAKEEQRDLASKEEKVPALSVGVKAVKEPEFKVINPNASRGLTVSLTDHEGDGTSGSNYTPPEFCVPGQFTFDKPTHQKLVIPAACKTVFITSWGAGGGRSTSGTAGGGGAFVNASGAFDGKSYDLIVVVGAAGASGQDGGKGGFPGGGNGGEGGTAGGGGGGFSGVFLVAKTDRTKNFTEAAALTIAAGGGGGGNGGKGQAGNGVGKADPASGNGGKGSSLEGGDGGAGLAYDGCVAASTRPGFCYRMVPGEERGQRREEVPNNFGSVSGGGGGGGFVGGGGGAGAGHEGTSTGGGGGSSVVRLGTHIVEGGSGTSAGFLHYPERGNSGNAGQHGKVLIQYY